VRQWIEKKSGILVLMTLGGEHGNRMAMVRGISLYRDGHLRRARLASLCGTMDSFVLDGK
jgi:hypothetical protein